MKKITLNKMKVTSYALLFGLSILFNLISTRTTAQAFCDNEFVYWTENFGTGTDPVTNANVLNAGLTFDGVGQLTNSGTYRVIDWTDQNSGWHKSPDHTPGDNFGRMIVINGNNKNFYRKGVTRQLGYPAGFYSVSFYAINVDIPGTCSPNPLLPVISIKAEYRDANDNWVELVNSPFTSVALPTTAVPTWVQIGGIFALPTTGTFVVKRIRFTLAGETAAGCGNDFAIDDLKLASCPSGGPAPVEFLTITAQQKGSGVNINWSTASELNNKYFNVERSTDGTTWSVIGTVQSQGNSSNTRNYVIYDAKPAAGINYYRIKQVDFDGSSKYSPTATYNLKITKTEISVLANPFRNNITIDFLSTRNQVVNSRLIDITGKQVLAQQLSISKGSTRKVIDQVTSLNRGMYILQISDENGEILFTDKLIKQ